MHDFNGVNRMGQQLILKAFAYNALYMYPNWASNKLQQNAMLMEGDDYMVDMNKEISMNFPVQSIVRFHSHETTPLWTSSAKIAHA